MTQSTPPEASPEARTGSTSGLSANSAEGAPVVRLKSRELMRQMREVEIDHEGRIYRLRVTQLNKLILTA
ncbi:hemin uptake protein HemP [Undibacterium sp.]|jgi:hemin uptake protein HemP|uniref:hemin uptake protein HemP n=1 Tax=Undibacterium sp. TaxID=1914977 RepID=UPI002D145038|nr:hemin uptake protein HemP [Undibacterium sp.]HTD03496.1 hemin uptake protein HemP [Undibacterium sp.]